MGLANILDALVNWAQSVVSTAGYSGLVLVMFLENIFPPIPSEAILPLAGSLVTEGRFTLGGVTLMGALGSVGGATVFYAVGYVLGEARVRRLLRRYGKWAMLSEADFDKALNWFNRYGEGVVFFGRMVPIVRSLVSIPAGIAGMNLLRFTIYTAIGTTIWSFLLASAGYLLGQNWPIITEWLNRYEKVVLGLCVLMVVVFIVKRLQNRRRVSDNGRRTQ